jgi:hypothetical protein
MSSISTTTYVPMHKRGLPDPPLTPPSSRSPSPTWPLPCPPYLRPSSPPTTRDLVGYWRTGATPLSSSSNKNLLSFDNVKLGMVFFLPDEQRLAGSRIHEQLRGSYQSPWCHPAVVVGKRKAADGVECVEIRLCTTFDGTHVEEKKLPHQQEFFMLADNAQDNVPHGNTVLAKMIPGSARFGKRSYINLSFKAKYTVEFSHLLPFNGKRPMQFDADALQRIRSCIPSDNVKPPMASCLKVPDAKLRSSRATESKTWRCPILPHDNGKSPMVQPGDHWRPPTPPLRHRRWS